MLMIIFAYPLSRMIRLAGSATRLSMVAMLQLNHLAMDDGASINLTLQKEFKGGWTGEGLCESMNIRAGSDWQSI
jgi:hypothetical protein